MDLIQCFIGFGTVDWTVIGFSRVPWFGILFLSGVVLGLENDVYLEPRSRNGFPILGSTLAASFFFNYGTPEGGGRGGVGWLVGWLVRSVGWVRDSIPHHKRDDNSKTSAGKHVVDGANSRKQKMNEK